MGTTPNYAIPYPELTDPPDGAGQMKALAQKVDTQLKAVDTAVKGTIPPMRFGMFNIPINTSVATVSATHTYATPFAAGAAPTVLLQSNNSAGSTYKYQFRVSGTPTNASFLALCVAADGANFTGGNNPSGWYVAMVPTTTPAAMLALSRDESGGNDLVTATCRNMACPRNGLALPDVIVPTDRTGWGGVYCGHCQQEIIDIRN